MKVYDRVTEAIELIVEKYWPQIVVQLRKLVPRALAKRMGYTDEQYEAFKVNAMAVYDQIIASVFHPIKNWQKTRAYIMRLQPKLVASKIGLKNEQYEKIVDVIAHPKKHWPEARNNIIDFKPRSWGGSAEGQDKSDFGAFVHGVIEPVKQKVDSLRHHRLPVDVMNFADKYALTADLPGYRKEDIDISAEGHFITIAVQTESVIENPDQQPDDASGAGEFIMHERNHSTYTRIIELPRPIDLDTLRGTYIDGVVRIEVLKQAVENHETVHISL